MRIGLTATHNVVAKRCLFILRSPFFLKNFDDVLLDLQSKGIDVDILFSSRKFSEQESLLINSLREKGYEKEIRFHPIIGSRWFNKMLNLMSILESIRYLNSKYDSAPMLRNRGLRKLSEFGLNFGLLLKSKRLRNSDFLVSKLAKFCQNFYLLKTPHFILETVASYDTIVVSPLTPIGSEQVFYGSAALQLDKSFVYALYSWDNLTNKGFIKPLPNQILIWNKWHLDELNRFQNINQDNCTDIRIVGSPGYEKWIKARQTKGRYKKRVSRLRIEILWLASSGFISKKNQDLEECLKLVSLLRDLKVFFAIKVRVHPQHAALWKSLDTNSWPEIELIEANGEIPLGLEAETLFVEQVYNSDFIIGINTSAMVEALILGKKVIAVKSRATFNYQLGTIHFRQLLELPDVAFKYLAPEEIALQIASFTKLSFENEIPTDALQLVDKLFLNKEDDSSSTRLWTNSILSTFNMKKKVANRSVSLGLLLNFLVLISPSKVRRKQKLFIFGCRNSNKKKNNKHEIENLSLVNEQNEAAKSPHSENTWDDDGNPTIFNIFRNGLTQRNENKQIFTNFFGDSVFYRTSKFDNDSRSLMQLTQENFGNVNFFVGSSHDIRLHRRVAQILEQQINQDINMVEVNLRSFSPSWYLNPSYSFVKEISRYDNLLGKQLIDLNGNSTKEFLNLKYGYNQEAISVGDIVREISNKRKLTDPLWLEREKLIMWWHYLIPIENDHPLLAEFRQLAELSFVNLNFFIAPINFQYGKLLFGDLFDERVAKNIDTLKNFFQSINLNVHDLSKEISSTDFISETEKTEHLNFTGRLELQHALGRILGVRHD